MSVPVIASGALPLGLFIDCGAGGDTVTAGDSTHGMDRIQGFLAITDNFSKSTLVLNDHASSANNVAYTVFSSELEWNGNQLDYAGLRTLVLDVGSGSGDVINWNGTGTNPGRDQRRSGRRQHHGRRRGRICTRWRPAERQWCRQHDAKTFKTRIPPRHRVTSSRLWM